MNPPVSLSCIIVDDEHMSRYGLRSYINRTPGLKCVAEFSDVRGLEVFLNEHSAPDILFLDINMPGMSGLDFITSHTMESAVVIVTAYEQYALRGFELNVCDYLLKPASYTRFMQAVRKAARFVAYRRYDPSPDIIYVRADRALRRIVIPDILYIESIENYVRINTSDARIIVRSTMKDLLAALPADVFVRIHKSYVVNRRHIVRITSNSVTLSTGQFLPLSRTYRPALRRITLTT